MTNHFSLFVCFATITVLLFVLLQIVKQTVKHECNYKWTNFTTELPCCCCNDNLLVVQLTLSNKVHTCTKYIITLPPQRKNITGRRLTCLVWNIHPQQWGSSFTVSILFVSINIYANFMCLCTSLVWESGGNRGSEATRPVIRLWGTVGCSFMESALQSSKHLCSS